MSYLNVSSDSGNRANGTLPGSTLDNVPTGGYNNAGGTATNTWSTLAGTAWAIASNRFVNTAGSGRNIAIVGSTPATADHKVTATFHGVGSGLCVRWDSVAQSGFVVKWEAGNTLGLYYVNAGSYSSLDFSSGTPVTDGAVVAFEARGPALNVTMDGVAKFTGENGTGYSSGRPGIYGDASTASLDDFIYERYDAPTAAMLLVLDYPRRGKLNVVTSRQVKVGIYDRDGVTPIPGATNAVSYALNRIGTASGSLSGTTPISAVAGIATPTDHKVINGSGLYTITASASGLTPVTTPQIAIDVAAPGFCTVTNS